MKNQKDDKGEICEPESKQRTIHDGESQVNQLAKKKKRFKNIANIQVKAISYPCYQRRNSNNGVTETRFHSSGEKAAEIRLHKMHLEDSESVKNPVLRRKS